MDQKCCVPDPAERRGMHNLVAACEPVCMFAIESARSEGGKAAKAVAAQAKKDAKVATMTTKKEPKPEPEPEPEPKSVGKRLPAGAGQTPESFA